MSARQAPVGTTGFRHDLTMQAPGHAPLAASAVIASRAISMKSLTIGVDPDRRQAIAQVDTNYG